MREPAARDVGAMRGNDRLFTEVRRSLWPRVHIRSSETSDDLVGLGERYNTRAVTVAIEQKSNWRMRIGDGADAPGKKSGTS
jgi:hypothetical protein